MTTGNQLAFSADFGPQYEMDQHSGYLSEVKNERFERISEITIYEPPIKYTPSYSHENIFTSELSREFVWRYERDIGRLEAEQSFYTPYDSSTLAFRGAVIADNDKKNEFGMYMSRRLIEYHIDNMAKKDDSALNSAYVVKESLKKVSVPVRPGYSFDIAYFMVTNSALFKVKNPYLDVTEISIVLDSASSSALPNSVIYLGKDVSRITHVGTQYKVLDQSLVLFSRYQMFTEWQASVDLTDKKMADPGSEKIISIGMLWKK